MKFPRLMTTTKEGEPARIESVWIQPGSHREHYDRELRYNVRITVLNDDGSTKIGYDFCGVLEGVVNSVLAEPVNLSKIMKETK